VTSCAAEPAEIWRDYNRRADMENRIAELKHDLGAHGFCLKQFFATEAAFLKLIGYRVRLSSICEKSNVGFWSPKRWAYTSRR
jgi:hypothetical protein